MSAAPSHRLSGRGVLILLMATMVGCTSDPIPAIEVLPTSRADWVLEVEADLKNLEPVDWRDPGLIEGSAGKRLMVIFDTGACQRLAKVDLTFEDDEAVLALWLGDEDPEACVLSLFLNRGTVIESPRSLEGLRLVDPHDGVNDPG